MCPASWLHRRGVQALFRKQPGNHGPAMMIENTLADDAETTQPDVLGIRRAAENLRHHAAEQIGHRLHPLLHQ